MCGIIGYCGEREMIPVLVDGLKKLQYRGYDSVGVSVINSFNELETFKRKGKISEFEDFMNDKKINSSIGIGHTRWATHGEPNERNAHPHMDCKREIAIIHNGIIENFNSLKELLISEGHQFSSDTDSEIIAHLIEKFYENDLEEATMKALKIIEGTFGLAIIHRKNKEIIAARRGSPLILGIGENEMFVTSDVTAILPYTKKVVYISDNEVVKIT